ncbi:hypothetical protein ACSQ67_022105 [Phaseolus vulgaris]
MFLTRPIFRGPSLWALHTSHAYSSASAAAIQAERTIKEGPRNDWSRDEVKSIYDSPVLDLLFHGVIPSNLCFNGFLQVVNLAQVHRHAHNFREVQQCTLLSIKTGGCSEDCSYCPQSSRQKRLGALGAAWRDTLGRKTNFNQILEYVKDIREMGMEVCCTLGMLEKQQAIELKKAGLTAYNHNLDTSREYYPNIITTRTYDERLETLEFVRDAGINVCSGPKRAFGDLIAASGITDEMLDSLIALKDFEGVDGLPPLSVIEDMRYERNTRKSSRGEMERLKQEEAAKARVKQVDDKGRAYGTGRRKCSVARVWVLPGNGKFIVNDKEFDVYFPMLDHRATLLRPFSKTKTLGLWDVNCTVKGGGVSAIVPISVNEMCFLKTGQVGAIRLGISKALQNWEPELRPSLRNAGFLTRDSRVVERKKPGKAKARKSFQWVKR